MKIGLLINHPPSKYDQNRVPYDHEKASYKASSYPLCCLSDILVVFVLNKVRVTGRHRFSFQGFPLLSQKSVKRDEKASVGSIFQVNPLSASIVSRMIGWNSAGIPSWRLRTHFDPSVAHLWHDMGRGIHLPGSRAGTGHGHEDPEGGELAKRPAKTV